MPVSGSNEKLRTAFAWSVLVVWVCGMTLDAIPGFDYTVSPFAQGAFMLVLGSVLGIRTGRGNGR